MLPFDEDRTPLTLDNVRSWAYAKFPGAFNVLPKVDEAIFLQVDDFTFARFIKRCLGRSKHKRLLVVGAHAPGEVAEDALVVRCALFQHTRDVNLTCTRINELFSPGDNELHTVKSTGHIEFHEPFSSVGDDNGNPQVIIRVGAIIRYYFLHAGHLSELRRHLRYPRFFTKGFEEGCRWIENSGERPVAIGLERDIIMDDRRVDLGIFEIVR